MRRTYGTKSEEVTGGWRKLHNDELYDLYSATNTGNQINDDEMNEKHSRHGRNETHITSKMGLVDNIKVGLKERVCRRCELDSGGSGHGSMADL